MQRAIGLDVTAIEALRGLIVIFVAAGLIWKLNLQKRNNPLAKTASIPNQQNTAEGLTDGR